jgi:hypothetical protein
VIRTVLAESRPRDPSWSAARVGWLPELRRALATLVRQPGVVFVLLGLVVALGVSIGDSDRVAQVRFTLTLGAFYLAGRFAERLLGVRGDAPWAPIHRIVLGQLVLVFYFYARSALAHLGLFGVGRFELYAGLGALAALAAWEVVGPGRARPVATDVSRGPDGGDVPLALPPAWSLLLLAAGVWAAWWISLHTFLAYRSGALQTPSSDPDGHAYLAKLVMMGGKLAYTQAPYSNDPQTYPSAFAVLNAIWAQISGAPIVKVVNCQLTLQACLAVGLIIEAAASLRRHLGLLTSLVLLAIAHWLFFFPVNSESLMLAGTARFAHSALLLWPLTLTLRLCAQSSDDGAQPTRLRLLGVAAAVLALSWAFAINPSHVIVATPIMAATAILLVAGIRRHPRSRPTARRWWWGTAAALLVLPALLVLSDALVVGMLRGTKQGAAGAVAAQRPEDKLEDAPLTPAWAIRAGFQRARKLSTLGVFPQGCIIGSKCQLLIKTTRAWWPVPVYLIALGYLFFQGWQLVRRRRARTAGASDTAAAGAAPGLAPGATASSSSDLARVGSGVAARPADTRALQTAAFAIVALAVAAYLVPFLTGFMEELMLGQRALRSVLLAEYTSMGLRTLSGYLYFLFLSVALVATALAVPRLLARFARFRDRRGTILAADIAIAAVLLIAMIGNGLVNPRDRRATNQTYTWQVTRAPKTSLGWIRQADVDFVKKVETIVPPGERVLLSGVAMRMHKRENWIFAESMSRAVPLYTKTHFAFFLSQGPKEFSPEAYMQHVCNSFDIPWLARNGVTWVVMSEGILRRSCIHNWNQIRGDYYEEVLRVEDRGLYRLRPEKLAAAARDPRLDLPLSAPPVAGPKGAAVRGFVEPHGPHLVAGWACDYGSPAHVGIELELTDRDDPTKVYREFHQAALRRDDRIAQACGGTDDHGFMFAPATVPRGTYNVRVLAYDGPGKATKLLAENFLVVVPL